MASPDAPPVDPDAPGVLPMTAVPLRMVIARPADPSIGKAVIGRQFADPDSCRKCPGRPCHHGGVGGFCMVEAPGDIPDELCGAYVLPAPAAAERSARRGI